MKNNKKITTYVIIAIICVVLFLIWFFQQSKEDVFVIVDADSSGKSDENNDFDFELATESEDIEIKVYINGEVLNPGVYEVGENFRIEDVLELAGGATDEANLLAVNLSEKIYDEQQIIIPKIGEEVDKTLVQTQNSSIGSDGKVNINIADKQTLKTLPGIGDTIADAIVLYREDNGGFENIEDIKNVYRIGDRTFDRIKDHIGVN